MQNAPAGSLKIKHRNGKIYYYQQYKNEDRGEYICRYITRKEEAFARTLAQKGYDIKVKPLLEKELEALENFGKRYNEKLCDDIYENLTDDRRQLIVPVRVNAKEQLYQWNKETYEPLELKVAGGPVVLHPDFTILNIHSGKIVYWEHAGCMGDAGYADAFVKKMNTYVENSIFPGDRLIVTYDTLNSPLNIHNVKLLVRNFIRRGNM